ncbi:hypothetical protein BBJ28_00014278 [Nothophytophthora sp. Chile5]|nr:hypothetical protein BBJ28_00014278 [Nothophytophthora sp. Chile5]
MLDSLLHRFFAHGSTAGKEGKPANDVGGQVSQETAFTREADVEGWVFLAEEAQATASGGKTRTYADVVAGRS